MDGLKEMDEDATIRCAIQCLQAVTDFRGNEVGCFLSFASFTVYRVHPEEDRKGVGFSRAKEGSVYLET